MGTGQGPAWAQARRKLLTHDRSKGLFGVAGRLAVQLHSQSDSPHAWLLLPWQNAMFKCAPCMLVGLHSSTGTGPPQRPQHVLGQLHGCCLCPSLPALDRRCRHSGHKHHTREHHMGQLLLQRRTSAGTGAAVPVTAARSASWADHVGMATHSTTFSGTPFGVEPSGSRPVPTSSVCSRSSSSTRCSPLSCSTSASTSVTDRIDAQM
mmetsp:Transcript_40572/g.121055  ORF Transcript_40572/g.121055 Transcript_40572/m.121055 type:complete len:207 (-) Transcript_40572:1613-2233(-)